MLARKIILLLPLLFFYTSIQIYAQDYIPVVLQWEPVEGADAYWLYYGTDSRHNPENIHPYNGTEAMKEEEGLWVKDQSPIDVGNVTQFTVQIPDDDAYFFAVMTVDNDKDYPYSDFSNEEATLCITWPEAGLYVNAANDSPYTVRGRANAGAEVELFSGATSLGTASTDGERDWEKGVDFEQSFSEGAVALEVSSEGITAPAVTVIYDMTNPASSVNEITSEGVDLLIKWTASDKKAGIETSGVNFTELWYKYMEVPVPKWEPTGLSLRGSGGIFSYTPTSGDGTYYFATRSVDRAGNWEEEPNGDGDMSINYVASINTSPTGKEGGGGGCFIDTLLPAHCH